MDALRAPDARHAGGRRRRNPRALDSVPRRTGEPDERRLAPGTDLGRPRRRMEPKAPDPARTSAWVGSALRGKGRAVQENLDDALGRAPVAEGRDGAAHREAGAFVVEQAQRLRDDPGRIRPDQPS